MTDMRVVPLHKGAPVPDAVSTPPSPAVLEALEYMLEEARAGRIQGLGCVYHGADWRSSYSLVGSVGGFSMQGALGCLIAEVSDINRAQADRGHA